MDENEFLVIQIRPQRYTKWSFVSMGLNLVSDVCEGASNWLGTFAIMAAQHDLQKKEDKKFQEITSGS
jgi:hypothetical protein